MNLEIIIIIFYIKLYQTKHKIINKKKKKKKKFFKIYIYIITL